MIYREIRIWEICIDKAKEISTDLPSQQQENSAHMAYMILGSLDLTV